MMDGKQTGADAFNVLRQQALRFESESGRCQPVQAAPNETVDRKNDKRHQHCSDQKDRIIPLVRSVAHHGAQAGCRKRPAVQVEVFGHNAGIPGAPGSGNKTGDQVGENSRQK